MNLIICGFHYTSHFPIIENVLTFIQPEYCQIIYDTEKLKLPEKTDAIFLKDDKINTYADYPVKWMEILPIDEDLIFKMSLCETIVLRMMDRLSLIPGFETYAVRKMTYLRHLQYWNHIIQTKNIKLVIFDIVPHQIYDYIIYELCKLYNIPHIVLMQTGVDDFTFFIDNLNEFNSNLKAKYAELSTKLEQEDENNIQLQLRSESHFKFQMSPNPMPFYTSNYLNENTFQKKIKQKIKIIMHNNPFKLAIVYFSSLKRKRAQLLLQKSYDQLAKVPDLTVNHIYFPLHLQPECSTCPMAGAFVDQLLIIKMLRYYIPKDVHIYVKEHVAPSLTGRSVNFYQEMANLPNVSLIQKTFSSIELTKSSIAVATATGTAGWEALFRGKPVLMFGSFFYEYAKGVFRIRTTDDMKRAVDHIFVKNFKPTLKDMKIYLKAMEETSVNGYIGLGYKVLSHLTESENIENLSAAIIQKVKSLKIS